MVRGRRLGVAVVVALLVSAGGEPASANHVSCGNVITQDTTLDSDLLNCPGDGVVIGAPGITLDLGGHLIDGLGVDLARDGVNNRAGHYNVTIENGTVREFDIGVDIGGYRVGFAETPSSFNAVRNLNISTDTGVIGWSTTGLTVERSAIVAPFGGIALFGSNLPGERGSGAIIRGNSVSPNIFLSPMDDALVELNTVTLVGLYVNGDRNIVTRNVVSEGGEAGIASFGSGGIVSRNQVTGGIGGLISFGSNLIEKNDFSHNARDGIRVEPPGRPELLHNTTNGNRDDGIDVGSPGTRVAKNRANGNGDMGIVAVSGVVDGGNNKASGNGDPAQCVGVTCK